MVELPPPKRQLTPIAEAIKVHKVAGNTSIFTATIAWDWCGAWAAHGGLLLALIHSTAKSYNLLTNPHHPQPDVLNSHIQYLNPVLSSSTVRLTVRPLKIGARVSVLQIELQTSIPLAAKLDHESDSEALSWKTHTIGIITAGNLATLTGLYLPTRESVPRSEIPDRPTECEEVVLPTFFSDIAPIILKFTGWALKGYNETMIMSDRFGRCTRDIWYARSDGEDWDVHNLGILCDFIEGAPANWSPNRADLKAGVRYPTLCMTTEIKKDPKGLKWVFLRARALKIENGRFDTLVYVCDEEGDLLAFAKHVSLIVEGNLLAEHPEEVGRVFKL
ncbi:thioesterase-like superfamily-domain-containing protein [Rhexocercosporidium sp. MPI-PUGE-AT-0058]|nr:thioesterase-like superfamily-domain-containing protein [Rhexocercosporidium sp. MPI-PUGE-AT-0058]